MVVHNMQLLIASLLCFISAAKASDLIISGVIDGPLTGGLPKAIEVYAISDIDDLSIYGLGSANNGGGTDGQEYTFPADSITAGSFIYVASEALKFNEYLGFAPDYTGGFVSINGDDAIELFKEDAVVDVFGDINVDGTGQPWEYTNGWVYRKSGSSPSSTFQISEWSFSGTDAIDGCNTNAACGSVYPLKTFGGTEIPSVTPTWSPTQIPSVTPTWSPTQIPLPVTPSPVAPSGCRCGPANILCRLFVGKLICKALSFFGF